MKIIATLILLGFSALSYTQTYFNERYNLYYNNGLDFAHNIIEYDTGYIVAGGTALESNNYRLEVVLSKISLTGELVFSNILSSNIWEYDIGYSGSAKYINNNIFAVGARQKPLNNFVRSEGVIYKFDSNLDTIWTKTIGDYEMPNDTNFQFRHFDLLPNNEMIIAGNIVIDGEIGRALLLKTDSLGNEQWRKYFNNGPLNIGVNVIQTSDGGFAISCLLWTFGTHQIAAPYIVKTDSLGNEQWRHYVFWNDQRHGTMHLQNTSDSTIIGAYSHSDSVAYPSSDSYNRDALIKLDLEGNVIWDKKYGESSWNKWSNSVVIDNDGNIITAGQKPETYAPIRQGYLFKTNIDGDSLWYRQYHKIHETLSRNYLYGVTPTADGGYISVGDVLPFPPDTGNKDVWLIKVDSMGCEALDECWTGIKEHISMLKTKELKIYPNPASHFVNIFIPKENESESHTLVVYDLYGRKVEETTVPPNTSTTQVSVLGWKSGLYTTITNYKGNISGRGKFIVR